MSEINRFPEQLARDKIDVMLEQAGWKVQPKDKIDFRAGLGIAVREYQTSVGPADYVLFVDKKPVGVVEAKPEDWGHNITVVEEQSGGYASAKLKWVEQFRAPSVCLRKHWGGHPFHRRRRSETALSGGVQFPYAGDDTGLAFPVGYSPGAAPGTPEFRSHGIENMSGQCHQWTRSLL